MISAFVTALRPLITPLLKLRFEPPALPEGSHTLRRLKPSERYLSYAYLGAFVGHAAVFLPALGVLLVAAAVSRQLVVSIIVAGLILAASLVSLAVTLVTLRVDWELRDYLIGSRSLRLRQGAIVQRELTLSYANVQNVEVNQGPIERLFGFKSLRVSTAGGGRGKSQEHGSSSHEARLVGLEDAEAVRELILGALRQHRDSGLGEPAPEAPRTHARLLEELRDAALTLQRAAERRARRMG
ncbi:MAG: PH domain-containing protein [Myxococcaceae bacterium]|nr:PH domain-containing protein [Myxococcaceae bacterium]